MKKSTQQHNNHSIEKPINFVIALRFFIDFSYSSLGMLRSKINKKGAKNPSKTSVKSTPQQRSILEPTWLHFGRVLGTKLKPSWHQIASKVDAKRYQKNDHLLDRSWEQFSWILASIWEPRWSPKPLSWSQDRAKTPQSWRQDRLKTSTWSQDGPKTSQDGSNTASGTDSGELWASI